MTVRKQRLTVTVDPELVEAAQRAVSDGTAASVSAWVSTALAAKIRRDALLTNLGLAIADYETEFGEISAEEIALQRRADRESALVVRGLRRSEDADRAALPTGRGGMGAGRGEAKVGSP